MRSLPKTLMLTLFAYGSYQTAWACSCAGGGASEDQIDVTGTLGAARGCGGRHSSHKLEITAVHNDPDGVLQVGDRIPVRVNRSGDGSCGVEFEPGDQVRFWSHPTDRYSVALCNSY